MHFREGFSFKNLSFSLLTCTNPEADMLDQKPGKKKEKKKSFSKIEYPLVRKKNPPAHVITLQ